MIRDPRLRRNRLVHYTPIDGIEAIGRLAILCFVNRYRLLIEQLLRKLLRDVPRALAHRTATARLESCLIVFPAMFLPTFSALIAPSGLLTPHSRTARLLEVDVADTLAVYPQS